MTGNIREFIKQLDALSPEQQQAPISAGYLSQCLKEIVKELEWIESIIQNRPTDSQSILPKDEFHL